MDKLDARFWERLDTLVSEHRLVIDRPRGSVHPRFPDWSYPLDYGHLEGTTSGDGDGIDVWLGTLPDATLTAVVCSVDVAKRDVEIKLLIGCSPAEIGMITALHSDGDQASIALERTPRSS